MTQIWDSQEPQEFRSGQSVPANGIYRIIHAEHRLSPEVTLLKDEVFPVCSQCRTAVRFELLRPAPTVAANGDFRVKLYALPVIEDKEEDDDGNGSSGSASMAS